MREDSVRRVDVLVAGAQKAGTTSLAAYLGEHPSICTHERVEFSYFVDDADYADGYARSYRRYFAQCDPEATLLAKSVTVMTERRLIERVQAHNPDIRVIISLRNPVERAYSAYWWARRKGYETLPTFEEALDASPERHDGNVVKVRSTSYLPFGHYAEQLADVINLLGRETVRIVLFDDLKADKAAVLRDLFTFIGVDASVASAASGARNVAGKARSSTLARLLVAQSPAKRRVRQLLPRGWAESLKARAERLNTSSFEPPPMNPATRRRLVEHFAPHNARLSELIGRDLSAWNR